MTDMEKRTAAARFALDWKGRGIALTKGYRQSDGAMWFFNFLLQDDIARYHLPWKD